MEMYFKPSDIVWVKLGPFWWPGEVVDRTQVPEEVTESLKKEPVAIVKFFDDEEYFECVKTADCICPYNCSRKNDFIKKGMDAFRAKNPKMSSFPKDVSAAEVKTGGNANILSDPIFSPERKRNYAAEIFGNPTPKKIKESNKGRANKQAPVITHRRFLGYDDYEARVLIQCPDRFSQPDAVAEPSSESDNESTKFTCPICPFVTDGLSVLLMHTNCHVKGSKHIAGPSSLKKPQKRKRKKVLSDEDLSGEDKKTKSKKYKKKAVANNTTSADGESSDNNESPAENNSQKYKPKKKDSAHSSESTSENKKDVCIDIIADWEDESNPDTTEEADISILDSIFNKTQKSENITVMESSSTLVDSALDTTSYSIEVEKLNSTLPLEEVMQKDELKEVEEQTIDEKKEKDTSISCFDFDEDEEDTRIPNATSGRKIPRVIPISDKRKSFNFDEDLIEKEEAQKKKILKESEQLGKSQESVTKDKETEELEKTYQSLMDSTSKIELPDIPNILKSEQNFRCGKTVKYPDKGQDSLEVIDAEVIEDTKSNLEGNSTTSNQVSSESLESHIEKRKSKEKRFSSRKTRWSRRSATSQSKNEETEINELLVKYSVDAEKDEDVSQNSQANASTAHDNGKIKDVLENDESSLKCNRSVTDHSVIENEILIETIAQNEISYEEFIYPENDEIGTSSECQKVERNENVNNEKLVDDEASGFKEKHFSDDSKNSKEILDGLLIENLIVNSSLEQVAKETKTVEQLENDKSSEMSKGAKKVEENLNSNKSIDTEKLDAVLDENLVSNALKQQNEIEMVIDKPQEITVDDKNNMEIDLRKTTIGVEKLKNLPDQVKLEFISSSRISSSKILDDKDCALDSQMSESSTVRSTRRGRSRDIEMDKKGKSEKSSLLSGEVDSAEEYPPSAKRERKVGRDNEEKVKQSNLKESGKQSASSRKSSRWDRKSATRDDTRPKQNELIDNKTHTTEIVDDHKFKEESSKTCMEKRESAKSEKPREPPSSSRSSRRRKSDRNENKPFVDKEANSLKEDTSSSHRSMKIDEQQHDSRKKDKQTIDVIKIEHGTSSNRSLRSDRSSSRNVQDNRRLSEQSDVIQNQEADRSSSQNKDHSSHRSSRSHRKPSRSDHEKQSPSKPRDLEHTSSHPSSRHEENLSRSDSERQKDSPRKDKSLADNQESYSSPKLSSKKGGRYRRREHDKHHIINQKDSIKADKTQCSNKNNVHKSDNSKNDSEGTELKNTEEDVSDSGKPNETLKKSDDSEMKQTGKHEPEKVSEDSMLCKSMQVHTKFDHLKLDDTKGINKSKHTDKNEPECSMPCISFQVQTESNTLELKHIEDNKPGSTKVEDSEENSSEDQMICRRVRVQTEESKKSAHKPNLFSMYRRLKNRNMSKTEIREELKKILLDNEKKMETECEENQSSRKHIENEISLNEVNKQLTEGSFPKSFLEVEKLRMDHKETLDHSKTSTSSTNIKEKTTKSSEHLTNMDENKEKLEKITTTCKNIGSHDNTDSEDHKSSRSHSKNETTNNSVQIVSESNKKNLEESELDSGSQPCSENKGQDDMNISLELNLDKQKTSTNKVLEQGEQSLYREKNPAKTENVEALAEEHELRKEKAKEEEKELLDENNSNHEQYGKWYRDQSKEKTELITKITTDDLMSTDSTCHDSTTYKHEDSTCIIPKSASRIDINVEKHEIPNNRSEEPVYSDLESTSHDFTGGKHSSVVAAPEAVEIKQMKLDQVSSNTVIKNDEVTIDEKNKISSMPPENPKKKRKPSRWDQKERSQTFKDHKPIYPKAQNKAYTKEQKSSNEEFPEKQEKANKISAVYSNASLDKTSEKESTLIEQSSVIDQNESEQIESIFGSSPLPKLNEDYIFSKEECKDTLKTSNAETPDIHAPNDSFVPQYESTETDISADKKLFDNAASSLTGVSSMDLLESVESQVARITHYEEPNFDEKSNEKAKDEKQRAKVESVFETPEKKLVLSIFDTPEDKSKIDNQTPESKLPMEKTLQKIKSECTSGYQSPERIIPKAKKNYLLVDKSKLETIQKSEEILRDKQVFIQNSITSVDKTLVNEVATKLTNPKKRFVKSFEDFELNKQKEKSTEEKKETEINATDEKQDKTENKTNIIPGIVGKSPIVFKLKKQILSKISNIFDEENEKNETIKPKVPGSLTIPKKKDLGLVSLKNESIRSGKPKTVQEMSSKNDKAEESSQSKNLKISLDRSLLLSNHDFEKPNEHLIQQEESINFNSDKKNETVSMDSNSSLEVHFADDNNSPVEFAIKTNLTHVGKTEELNELVSLVNIHRPESSKINDQEHQIDDSKTEIITKSFPLENKKEEPELVPIDGNLTVVSEKELAEGQVEITASMPNKKPVTLMNFSMDFSDDSSDASFEVFKKEKIMGIAESLYSSKNYEDDFKELTAGGDCKVDDILSNESTVTNKVEIGNTSSELISNIEIEHTLENTITTKIELNKDAKTEIKVEENQNVGESLKVEESNKTAVKINESSSETKMLQLTGNSQANELIHLSIPPLRGIIKAPNQMPVKDKTKECDKIENSHLKKIDRKSTHLVNVDNTVSNEPLVIYNTAKSSTVTDMCDLEDHIPSQIVCAKNALMNEEVMKVAGISNELKECSLPKAEPSMSKLLSRLTSENPKEDPLLRKKVSDDDIKKKEVDLKNLKMDPNTTKTLIKAAIKSKSMGPQPISATTKFCNKAIILSEKIITPARDTTSLNSTMKRSYEDVEDIKSYIITKNQKLDAEKSDMPFSKVTGSTLSKTPFIQSTKQIILNAAKQMTGVAKSSGKAKILNQTIIRPAGEMFQEKSSTSVEDNIEFDINSMPIVISDELLTAESLENMPIVLGDNIQKTQNMENMKVIVEKKHPPSNTKLVNKTVAVPSIMASTVRMPAVRKMQTTKILQTSGQTQKINRHASPVMTTSKSKYIVLPESPNRTIQMAKKPNIVRRSVAGTGVVDSTAQNVSSESTGHKIMIVTNQQGQQQRVLLTPAQQKMFGMQLPKAGKTVVKSVGNQKVLLNKGQTISTTSASTSKIQGQFISSTKASSKPQICTTQIVSPQIKLAPPRKAQKLCLVGSQINKPATQKTILIKNQHGQTVRKIQGTDDALLDKQVAEQLEAIKVSSLKAQQRQQELSAKTSSVAKQIPNITRKPYSKRPEIKQTLTTQTKQSFHLSPPNVSGISKLSERGLPPLAPIKADKKSEDLPRQAPETKPIENKPSDRPLNQVVIQDNMGNQTTVTEGQILAVANETVDGQPKSYMLVTVDEAGNFTPLNNETLMSLDPSLAGLTRGDLSNMVLQMDPAGIKDGANTVSQLQAPSQEKVKIDEETSAVFEKEISTKPLIQTPQHPDQVAAQVQVTCNMNGEPGQQIILSGDPIATQKFLDSLSEGNTDLANILAHAEGSSFLIQTDDQQILINTGPTDTQMSQSTTTIAEQPEQGNPMFATHPIKNQDILAAALADTDVFQQDQVTNQSKVLHSQLSPGQNLFPLNVGNVLETSLTLNSPIMTPLEVPSTNSKIIPDEEADILTTHVPKNVDLPITITDPNISQTVSHQQVLMASDLQTNLELSLPISETAISVTSEMNSPSFVYSLPNLDVAEHTEISQKSFSSSMPLLTEDIDETSITATTISVEEKLKLQQTDSTGDSPCREKVPHINIAETLSNRRSGMITSDGTFMEEGLCTLGGEMCSSLSEPPPEMFDIPISNDSLQFLSTKSQNGCKEKSHTSTMEPALLADENSMEIPVQPQIVADLKDPSEEAQNSVSDETPM